MQCRATPATVQTECTDTKHAIHKACSLFCKLSGAMQLKMQHICLPTGRWLGGQALHRPSACHPVKPCRGSLQVSAAVAAKPAQLRTLDAGGSDAGSAELALRVAPGSTAKGLVHRYLLYVRTNSRQGTSSTKTRSEVSGGGRKPYKQKGTGSARAGSKRSPLFVHGGVVFGPKPRDWSIKMNRKERRLAYATALNSAAGNITVIPDFQADLTPRTKELTNTLQKWGADLNKHSLLVTSEVSKQLQLAGRNIEKLHLNSTRGLKIYDLLQADQIYIEQSALSYINEFFGPQAKPEAAAA